jgi:hypothetical protein
MEVAMNRLPAIALAVVIVLVGSAYISSAPATEAQVNPAPVATSHLDPHVGYYEQYLINIGIVKRK